MKILGINSLTKILDKKILFALSFCMSLLTIKAQINFSKYSVIPTGADAEVVCIGDVNNDNLNDIVVGVSYGGTSPNNYTILVYTQNNNGGLDSPVKYSYPLSSIKAIAIGDINGDNLNDVIIGLYDSIGYYIQNTNKTLNKITTLYSGSGISALKCGDMNNDGLTDIVVSHWGELYFKIFYQSKNGLSSVQYNQSIGGIEELELGDINNDNLMDLVVYYRDSIFVFTQDVSGAIKFNKSYTTYTGSSWNRLNGIAIGDINNDNLNDVVASMGGNRPNAKVVAWNQVSASKLLNSSPSIYDAYDIPEPIEIADLDCDGKNEIITVHGGWQKLSIYKQNNFGQFDTFSKYNLPYASHYDPDGLSIGDINSDGRKDIAIADYNSGLVILINTSNPNNSSGNIISTKVIRDTIGLEPKIQNSWLQKYTTIAGTSNIQLDSFIVKCIYERDSIKKDSIIIKRQSTCSTNRYDTSTYSFMYLYNHIPYCDTSFHSRTIFNRANTISNNHIMEVKLWPNPANTFFNIKLLNALKYEQFEFVLSNTLGKTVNIHKQTLEYDVKIDVSHLSEGLYFLKIINKEGEIIYLEKLEVKR